MSSKFLKLRADILVNLNEADFLCFQSLGRANTMEVNQGFGESFKMLDDRPFFKLLHATR